MQKSLASGNPRGSQFKKHNETITFKLLFKKITFLEIMEVHVLDARRLYIWIIYRELLIRLHLVDGVIDCMDFAKAHREYIKAWRNRKRSLAAAQTGKSSF